MPSDLELTPEELAALLAEGTPLRLLDVREEWEFEYNRIPGAELFPMDQIEFGHAARLNPAETIVCYCHHGMRSFQVTLWLRHQGYGQVRSLAGGIARWADERDPDMPRY